ncbi:MAG: ATP-dependent sacrificial sulfur transferase LarE [Candidatus Altiarchaeota archaeon]|nr:ATP-dependent sacrificial sulfur transferase LarE [Candidatus Altiarchaeota archaeon]
MELEKYLERFKNKKTAVAYSGGVDSSIIAFYARDFADAVLVRSELTPGYMAEKAQKFAEKYCINLKILNMEILREAKSNPPDRCYLCKGMICSKIKSLCYEVILDGTNADDLGEDRPGLKANLMGGVVSPLAELGLGKRETRALMSRIDKKVASQPSETCLATRIPHGEEITMERLNRIDRAEDFIRSLGVGKVRVRDHFPLARIQVQRDDFDTILKSRRLIQRFKDLGYQDITLDLEGIE